MPRRLPPLAALRAFEAAGRHLSFSKAGDELLISQSAVSHHIRTLEASLGVTLFRREVRAVSLTPDGARYLASVRPAFDLLVEGTDAVTRTAKATVRVNLLASFATHWLVPRLGRFRARHPGIELMLDPAIGLVDLETSDADLAIRYGQGNWPGIEARRLMDERIAPVASPALIVRGPAIAAPADLLGHEILFSYSRTLFEWDSWSRAAGLDLSTARRSLLHDYNIVLQAALDGQGVAIGRHRLVRDRLASGQLVQPLTLTVHAGIAWWLILPRRKPTRAAAAFVDWLAEEAAMDEFDSSVEAVL
ncbi:LysR family transcriptional regulator [Aliidongia dinghuensis]|uniref:LysR family transcriptional regulator n=1 Tax=Aliidongia dinghuensis TaxID=1867774 RepID=A0A8J3E7M5_9PROT|nr:transcriptional regulator GcvA [Aliidongia dinghuensis]GGF45091.1 LysR family transcriptional regulator [Aliidongia dinghuensis]